MEKGKPWCFSFDLITFVIIQRAKRAITYEIYTQQVFLQSVLLHPAYK